VTWEKWIMGMMGDMDGMDGMDEGVGRLRHNGGLWQTTSSWIYDLRFRRGWVMRARQQIDKPPPICLNPAVAA